MHHHTRKDSFPSAVAEVNKGTTWQIKGVVPAIWVLVPPLLLDPLKDLMERFVFNFTVGQICRLYAFLLSFTSALLLAQLDGELLSETLKNCIPSRNLGMVFLSKNRHEIFDFCVEVHAHISTQAKLFLNVFQQGLPLLSR